MVQVVSVVQQELVVLTAPTSEQTQVQLVPVVTVVRVVTQQLVPMPTAQLLA